MGCRLAHAKRVKISRQMPPDPVGPDDHQRPDAIENGPLDLLVRDLKAFFRSFRSDLFARRFQLFGGPFTRQRAREIIAWHGRPIAARPAGPLGLAFDADLVVAHGFEELLPGLIDRIGVRGIAGVHLFKVFSIVPLHKA